MLSHGWLAGHMQSGLAACSLGFHKVSGHPFLDSVRGQVTVGEAVLTPVQVSVLVAVPWLGPCLS